MTIRHVISAQVFHRPGWARVAKYTQVIECFATINLLYITGPGQYSITIINLSAQLAVPAYIGVFNTVLLAIFIYATGPASGGHSKEISNAKNFADLFYFWRSRRKCLERYSGSCLER